MTISLVLVNIFLCQKYLHGEFKVLIVYITRRAVQALYQIHKHVRRNRRSLTLNVVICTLTFCMSDSRFTHRLQTPNH